MPQTPFLTTLYGLLLRLYPRPFRQEFAAEMQQVFAALVSEAAQQREQPFLRLCLREFGGLLMGIVQEWYALLHRSRHRFSPPSPRQPVPPAPWSEVLLTLFPGGCMLIGHGYLLFSQLRRDYVGYTDLWYPGAFGAVLNWLLIGWLLVVLLRVALRQRFDPAALPLLGLSTALLALGVFVFPLSLLAARVAWGGPLMGPAVGVSILLVVIVSGGIVARRHGAHALLVILPVVYLVLNSVGLGGVGVGGDVLAVSWGPSLLSMLALCGWLVVTPLALLRAPTVGWQLLAASVVPIGSSWGITLHNRLWAVNGTHDLYGTLLVVLCLMGGSLALVGWGYAWLATALPATYSHTETEQHR